MLELRPIPEMLSISPFGMSIYNDFSYLDKKSSDKSLKNLKDNNHKGLLSPAGRKNLKNCIGYLILKTQLKNKKKSAKKLPDISKKISFATLTLPSKQKHPDNQIKDECLHQLILELQKKYNMREYVWRAERQKNKNLHIHFLTNVFIPHEDLRLRWNRIINKLNYVDVYRKKHQNLNFNDYLKYYPTSNKKGCSIQDRIRQYDLGCKSNWNNPNSTDIVALKHVKNAANYISKYCSKTIDDDYRIKKIKKKINESQDDIEKILFADEIDKTKNQIKEEYKIEGRIWFASSTLTSIKNLTTELTTEIKIDLNNIIKQTKAKELKTDFCHYINRGIGNIIESSTGILNTLCNQFLLFNFASPEQKLILYENG